MGFIVGIDGPAGSGKGTITKKIANKIGLINIDTGITYRCVALKALKENAIENGVIDKEKTIELSQKINMSSKNINFFEKKVYKNSEFIVGDGLEKFSAEIKIDFAIIAGMGGIEIAKILLNRPRELDIKKFILQPNNNVVYLRRALVQNGFRIILDEIVLDNGIFYNVLLVKYGLDQLRKNELEFGRTNLEKFSPDFLRYLEFKLSQLTIILDGVKGTEKEIEVSNLISEIKKVLKGRKINATRNK